MGRTSCSHCAQAASRRASALIAQFEARAQADSLAPSRPATLSRSPSPRTGPAAAKLVPPPPTTAATGPLKASTPQSVAISALAGPEKSAVKDGTSDASSADHSARAAARNAPAPVAQAAPSPAVSKTETLPEQHQSAPQIVNVEERSKELQPPPIPEASPLKAVEHASPAAQRPARPASAAAASAKTPSKPVTPISKAVEPKTPNRTPHFASPTRASAGHSGVGASEKEDAATKSPAASGARATPASSPVAARKKATPTRSAQTTPSRGASTVKSSSAAASSPSVPRSSSVFDRLASTGTASSRAKRNAEGISASTSSSSLRSSTSDKPALSPSRSRTSSSTPPSPTTARQRAPSAASTVSSRARGAPGPPASSVASTSLHAAGNAVKPRFGKAMAGVKLPGDGKPIQKRQGMAIAPAQRTVADPHAAPALTRDEDVKVTASTAELDASDAGQMSHIITQAEADSRREDASSAASSVLTPSFIEEHKQRSSAPSPVSPQFEANGAPAADDEAAKKVPIWMKRGGQA